MAEVVSVVGGGGVALALLWLGRCWRSGAWGLPQSLPLCGKRKAVARRVVLPPWSWRLRGAGVVLLGLHLVVVPPSSRTSPSNEEQPVVVLALDVSASMAIQDVEGRARLEAARQEAIRLVQRSCRGCRLGLVVFGREAHTLVPPTSSHSRVVRALEEVEASPLEDATALGEGLGLAAHRAVEGMGSRRVVVVFTDGRSNGGAVDPFTAVAWARRLGVRVYAMGVGGLGGVEPLEEEVLERLAREGGGAYFRFSSAKGLEENAGRREGEWMGGAFRTGREMCLPGLLLWAGVGCLLLEGVLMGWSRGRVS